MSTSTEYVIIKNPLDNNEIDVPIRQFKRMPILYLELIENKFKVKPDLINTTYEPRSQLPVKNNNDSIDKNRRNISNSSSMMVTRKDQEMNNSNISTKYSSRPSIYQIVKPVNLPASKENFKDDLVERSAERLERDISRSSSTHSDVRFTPYNPKESMNNQIPITQLGPSLTGPSSEGSKIMTTAEIHHEPLKTTNDQEKKKDVDERVVPEKSHHNDDDDIIDDDDRDDGPSPPTLSELRARNPDNPLLKKDFRYVQEEDAETIKERNELEFHFEVLKRMHPTAVIPEYNAYSDPKIMRQKYDRLSKRLSLDSSVENWKRYMIIFVMGCEVGLGKLNFDMEGFAQQQIISMPTYDSLLIELAEKNYVPTGSRWPVELRLLAMIIMNMVLFIVSKIIAKRTGTNLLGSINTLTNPQPERTMKPPGFEAATGGPLGNNFTNGVSSNFTGGANPLGAFASTSASTVRK